MEVYIWLGILFCAVNAAVFSGLNLAIFRIPYLKLRVLAKKKNKNAIRVLRLRKHPNFLLATILWANVAYNVLLTLLTNSIMTGVVSFFFSTVVLTLVGEILPQSFFSRYALSISGFFAPMLRFYEILLYPIAKPTAWSINHLIGEQPTQYYTESDLIDLIQEHTKSENHDISSLEALGAVNFLKLDDKKIKDVGRVVSEIDLIVLDFEGAEPVISFSSNSQDPFLQKLHAGKSRYAILLDKENTPRYVLNKDTFFRSVFMGESIPKLENFCLEPVIVSEGEMLLGEVLHTFFSEKGKSKRENRVVLLWNLKEKRIFDGNDLLGLLMQQKNEALASY